MVDYLSGEVLETWYYEDPNSILPKGKEVEIEEQCPKIDPRFVV
jgi:hypothetical protein